MILVAGLGRCGTSLVMQMLHAGGVPVHGSWPSYEDPAQLRDAARWWSECAPWSAAKVIDPHRFTDRWSGPAVVIFLSRDHVEQARSALRFMMTCGMTFPFDSEAIKRWSESLDAELPIARGAVTRAGARPALHLRFGAVVESTACSVEAICDFLRERTPWHDLDREAMAEVVVRRSAAAMTFPLETRLLEQGPPSCIRRRLACVNGPDGGGN